MKQLSLPVLLDDECTFTNFLPGNNQAVLNYLSHWIDKTSATKEQFLYLWGAAGSGCSHLLQAACQEAQLKNISHYYINFNSPQTLAPSILQDLENIQVIALDHIQRLLGNL